MAQDQKEIANILMKIYDDIPGSRAIYDTAHCELAQFLLDVTTKLHDILSTIQPGADLHKSRDHRGLLGNYSSFDED